MWAHSFAGSPIPFYDQWVFGFNNLALSESAHSLAILRVPHNEHRIITTQCIELLGLWWNGYYDVRVTLIVAALVRALNALLAFELLTKQSKGSRFWPWIGCFFVCAIPYSGYNALNGMMVCMYFSDLALLLSILVLQRWPSSFSWVHPSIFIGASILGLSSFSQAILIPGATLCVHLVSRRARPGFLPTWCITAVLAFLLFAFSPSGQPWTYSNINTILRIIGWPIPISVLCASLVVFYAVTVAKLFCSKLGSSHAIHALLGIAVYSGGAALLLALKRSDDFNIRHYESIAPLGFAVLAIGTNVNSKRLRTCSFIFLSILCVAWTQPLRQTWSYYKANHTQQETALKLVQQSILQGKMGEFGEIIHKKILTHDYTFFLDPILQYSPGKFVGNFINQSPNSLLKMSPELFPVRDPTNLSLFLYALVELHGIFLVIAVALLYPWYKIHNKQASETQISRASDLPS